MSNQTYTIVIEGLPYCLGNLKPTWYAGTLDDGLVEHPRVNQSIDLMGGVARFDDVEFEIVDHLTRWAPFFRPVQPTSWRVISPNPIEYNTTTVTFEDATGIAVPDILYAENDTWEVRDISAAPDLSVKRQIYSCLEAGWACRYQSDITRDYVTEVSRTGPPTIMGRMMAIYIDGNLEYIGRITDLKQQGRAWSVRTTSILNVLTQAIQAPNVGIRLRHDWNYNVGYWSAGDTQHQLTPATGRGGSVDQMVNDWQTALYATSQLSLANAWQWVGDDNHPTSEPGEIKTGATYHGAVQTLGNEWKYRQGYGYVTQPEGIFPYGAIFTRVGTDDYLEVSTQHRDGAIYRLDGYVGQWVVFGDQYVKILSTTWDTGRVYFGPMVDIESGKYMLYESNGIAGLAPIELTVAPVILEDSIPSAIAEVLTGTGALGLGLPTSLYSDSPTVPQGTSSPVWWDWSKGGIDEDMRAHGLSLVLRSGVIEMIQVLPPIDAASTDTILQADLCGGEIPEIARGYEAPVASITYKDLLDRSYTVAWTATTGPARAALRSLVIATTIRGYLTDPEAWMLLQAARLQWLAVGVPTMMIQLLADTLQVGQVVTLASRYVSDGHYKTDTLPAIVIARDPGTAEYQLAMNLIPSAGAVWAFSIEVSSAAGAVITPVLQADLARFAAVVPVGTAVQITENDGTSQLWFGTIASYQATTVTLSDAPSLGAADVAILTCESIPGTTYGDLIARQVYAADTSGLIDSTYDAKELT